MRDGISTITTRLEEMWSVRLTEYLLCERNRDGRTLDFLMIGISYFIGWNKKYLLLFRSPSRNMPLVHVSQ